MEYTITTVQGLLAHVAGSGSMATIYLYIYMQTKLTCCCLYLDDPTQCAFCMIGNIYLCPVSLFEIYISGGPSWLLWIDPTEPLGMTGILNSLHLWHNKNWLQQDLSSTAKWSVPLAMTVCTTTSRHSRLGMNSSTPVNGHYKPSQGKGWCDNIQQQCRMHLHKDHKSRQFVNRTSSLARNSTSPENSSKII